MARQVLPIVGLVVGAYFGNPQLGYAIGAMIGNAVDPQHIQGPRLREGPTQTYGEGAYRSVVFGTSWIWDCQVLDWGPIRKVTVEEQQGKGGGPVLESERGYQTFAIGLGEPVEAIRVIRLDAKIVYDVRPDSTMLAESAAFAERFRFYDGSEDQLPDPDLEALPHNGVGNTPYYRGTSYLVFPNFDVTDLVGRIPTIEVEAVRVLGDSFQSGASVMTNIAIYTGPYGSLTGTLGGRDITDGISQGFAITADGQYLSGGSEIAPRFGWWKWDQTDEEYKKLPNPSGLPSSGGIRYTAWDESGVYLAALSSAISGAERLLVYKRSGDTLTKLAFSGTWDPTAGSASGLCITSTNGLRVAYSLPSGDLIVHNIINDVILDGVVSEAGAGFAAESLSFSAGGGFVVMAIDAGVLIWDVRSPDQPAVLFDSVATGAGAGAVLSPNGGFLYVFPATGDEFSIYSFNEAALLGEALEFVGTAPLPTGSNALQAAVFGTRHLGVALSGSPAGESLYVMDIDTDDQSLLTPLAVQPSVGTDTSAQALAVPARGSTTLIASNGVSLGDLIAEICDRCGLESTQLDVSELTEEVDGVTLGGPYNGAGAITILMPAFFFDMFEADHKLRFPVRGAAVKDTITVDDLIDEPDENTLRGQAIEYPRSLLLKYLDPGQNYAAPAATVQRNSPDVRVRGEATAELPVAMSRTLAYRVADRMLKVMWEDLGGEVTFSLPAGPFAWLTPTDCLGLSLRGALYRIRVEKVEYAAGVLKVTARRDRQSAYTSNLTPIPLPTPTPPPASLPGATQFVVLNIPGIVDSDDAQLGLRVGVCGLSGFGWSGCTVQLSSDGGVSYSNLANITTRARIGNLLEPLQEASPYYTDTTNAVRVLMLDDRELESVTQAQFLSEENPAAIAKPDGTAELIQFRDVTDEGDNEWTLETLLRGRLNTTPITHSAGVRFVMLSGTVLLPLPSSLLGQSLTLRFVSFGTSPEVAPTYSFTWNPAHSQTEWEPADLAVTRTGGNIEASWTARHRFGTEDSPIPSSDFRGFRVVMTDGTTTTTSDTTATSLGAADGFTGPVTVSVAELNRVTGPGPTTSEVVA
jgi:hypothetical protein